MPISLLKVFAEEIEQVKELEKDRTVQEYIKAVRFIRKHWVYASALDIRKQDWDMKKEFMETEPEIRRKSYEEFISEDERVYWQKACDLDQNSREYKLMLVKALWIFARFHEWLGRDWSILIGAEEKLLKELRNEV